MRAHKKWPLGMGCGCSAGYPATPTPSIGAAGGRRIAADQLGHREAGGDAPIGHLPAQAEKQGGTPQNGSKVPPNSQRGAGDPPGKDTPRATAFFICRG